MATVILGYDGSEGSDRAIKAACDVLAADRAIVVCVWEPSLPALVDPAMGELSLTGQTLDPVTERAVDDALESSAHHIAARGAEVALAAGFATAEPVVASDGSDVAGTLARLADVHGAAAIAIGSHGHRGVLSRVMGTTGTALLRHSACPVLVVPAGHDGA